MLQLGKLERLVPDLLETRLLAQAMIETLFLGWGAAPESLSHCQSIAVELLEPS